MSDCDFYGRTGLGAPRRRGTRAGSRAPPTWGAFASPPGHTLSHSDSYEKFTRVYKCSPRMKKLLQLSTKQTMRFSNIRCSGESRPHVTATHATAPPHHARNTGLTSQINSVAQASSWPTSPMRRRRRCSATRGPCRAGSQAGSTSRTSSTWRRQASRSLTRHFHVMHLVNLQISIR